MSDDFCLPLTPELERYLDRMNGPGIVVPISDETTNKELDAIEKEWDARIIEAEDNKLASDMAQFSQGVDFDHEF